ncbi:MAG TPA: FAD-binding oxidoreductase [Acidimicrobiia bacterium]|nr:FAD-binding oxidoreductase [Acidimicrobiia bacterium]
MATTDTARFDLPGFSGELLYPGDPAHDEARAVFNAMIDRSPVLIAVCRTADDVVAAVNLARREGITLSVYGGGHGVTGSAVVDGGICVDLRGMKGISVDPEAQTVRAEGGVTWGEFDAATADQGLAVTGGRVPSTGIAGLALGSGSGWLERKFGFTCDNLIRAEVVTADGRKVVASETENPDLFWGLRGGGGNFGIVTAFHFRLHPLPPAILAGMLVWPVEVGVDLVRFYRDFMLQAPDEVGGGIAFITAPPADFVPPAVQGHPVIGMVVTYAGPPEEGERVVAPLREFGPPAVDLVDAMPYVVAQQLIEPSTPHGMQNYWTADFYDRLPDEAVDVLVGHATKPVSPLAQVLVVSGGGAIARVPDDATAFGQRHSEWNIHYLSMWPDPADNATNIEWTKTIHAAMKPWAAGGVYLNYIGDEGQDRVESGFGPEKYRRLQALKTKWDPDNLFRHNQNIRPA